MQRAFIPAVALVCLVILTGALFGKVLVADHQFALRDVGYFYYPLYQRVQQEWQAGRIPLWEMEENAGMPLLGNPSAAVLYPGKVVYGLFPYPWAARFYVVGHVLLGVRGAMVAAAVVGRESGRCGTRGTGLRLRRAGGLPVLQHHFPGRRSLGSMGFSRRRSDVAARKSLRDLGACPRAGHGNSRRRPADRVSDRGVRSGIRGWDVAFW